MFAKDLQHTEEFNFTPLISKDDIYLFNEGRHNHLYRFLGAHPVVVKGRTLGVHFAVWAPNAQYVNLIGDFNQWNKHSHPMNPLESSGIWTTFIPGIKPGAHYKYHIISHYGLQADKADPFAFYNELAPATASIVWSDDFAWEDQEWMNNRAARQTQNQPFSIYEVHLGSWRRVPEENDRPLNYREIAPELAKYVNEMGFTHVEFLPLTEHPFYGSWGYQSTGYFAPTSRYGTPQDFKYLVNYLHQHGIGVILDWVPSHFPNDPHGLAFFDGTHLYEHQDPRLGFHPDWKSAIFNYGRHEVRSFLFSSAMFWLDHFHIDGLRVDAVASMLYLDYSRKAGEWIPNYYGGRENLDAILFLRQLNENIYKFFPDTQIIAEESTSWGMVSRPTYIGGLGFGYKWDMGWMHDTLKYFQKPPIFRNHHQDQLTFRMLYAFTENFILPLSHDEVVHGKGSLIGKMPGDDWQKFANLRLLFGYQFAQPGKKLLFMGGEFAQWDEWNHDHSLQWHLAEYDRHHGMQRWIQTLNTIYKQETALHQHDTHPDGFAWIDCSDYTNSILVFCRRGITPNDVIVVVLNFTPMTHFNYRVGVPLSGEWFEIANSDQTIYGGVGKINSEKLIAVEGLYQNQPQSIEIVVPPLGIVFLKPQGTAG